MIANLRDCARIYDCGNGTEKSCKQAFCPFYKQWMTEPKHKKPIKAKMKIEEGEWVLDDFSMMWKYVRKDTEQC